MRSLLVVLLIGLGSICQAAPAVGGEVLTLEDCLRIALEKNLELAAAQSRVDESRARVGEARAGFFPQLDLGSTASRSESSYKMVLPGFGGTESQPFTVSLRTNRYDASINLRQNIWDFGRTTGLVRQGKAGVSYSQSSLGKTRLDVALSVKQAYFALLTSEKMDAVAQKNRDQAARHLEMAEARLNEGVGTKAEVIRARVALSEADLGLIRSKDTIESARWGLNRILGRLLDDPIEVKDVAPLEGVGENFEASLAEARRNRPELQQVQDQIRLQKIGEELARSERLPTLLGSATYQRWNDDWPLEQANWSYGLSLSLPVFDGFRARSRAAAARANVGGLERDAENLRGAIALEVKMSLQKRAQAARKIAVAERYVKEARENLDMAEGRYQEGLATQVELIDAQTASLSAQQNYEQAIYDLHLAQAEWERAVGVGDREWGMGNRE